MVEEGTGVFADVGKVPMIMSFDGGQSPAGSVPTEPHGANTAPYPLTVYYDGACPICRREISLMRRLDRRGRLLLIDFAPPTFCEPECGLSCEQLSAVIHARWGDGRVIQGVEVFRAMWTAVGLGWLARVSRWSFIDRLLVRSYVWFAKHRLRLTGRG